MPYDFEMGDGLTFGEWLRARVHEEAFVETHGWAAERVARVAARLQAGRTEAERLVVEVPWLRAHAAFTGPGRYVYFGRRLLERCPDDETAAFVVGHEIAHDDLEHVRVFAGWAAALARIPGGVLPAGVYRMLEHRLHGPEQECDADLHGLRLCIRAGYDPHRCVRFFDIVEEIALDYGNRALVYGPDPADDELAGGAGWRTRARTWIWQRMLGYLPIRERKAALLRFLANEAKRAA